MKILVAIKRVQDYNVKVRPKSDGSDVDIDGVKMGINPFDENALEEALRLREQELATEITVVSIGDSKNDMWQYDTLTGIWHQLFSIPAIERRGGIAFTSATSLY